MLLTPRSALAEFIGSAALALTVVGSGIAGESLSNGSVAIALLINAVATAGALFVLIELFGSVSGAHFNPVVSVWAWSQRALSISRLSLYVLAQVAGCTVGTILANLTFSERAITISTHARASVAHGSAEILATAGLLVLIGGLSACGKDRIVSAAVACYIGAGYFTFSSTSFANPAITVGRMFTNSFAGIAPASAPLFVAAQIIGGLVGAALIVLLFVPVSSKE